MRFLAISPRGGEFLYPESPSESNILEGRRVLSNINLTSTLPFGWFRGTHGDIDTTGIRKHASTSSNISFQGDSRRHPMRN